MDSNNVRALLIDAINEIQHHSGRPVAELDESLCPFSDIEGFDSLNGEEVINLLHEKLDFDDDFDPFESDNRDELTIGEIADALAAAAKEKEKVR